VAIERIDILYALEVLEDKCKLLFLTDPVDRLEEAGIPQETIGLLVAMQWFYTDFRGITYYFKNQKALDGGTCDNRKALQHPFTQSVLRKMPRDKTTLLYDRHSPSNKACEVLAANYAPEQKVEKSIQWLSIFFDAYSGQKKFLNTLTERGQLVRKGKNYYRTDKPITPYKVDKEVMIKDLLIGATA
jgi:hypothetical protein